MWWVILCWGKAGLCVVGDCCVTVKLVSVWWVVCVRVKLVSVWWMVLCQDKAGLCVVGGVVSG